MYGSDGNRGSSKTFISREKHWLKTLSLRHGQSGSRVRILTGVIRSIPDAICLLQSGFDVHNLSPVNATLSAFRDTIYN